MASLLENILAGGGDDARAAQIKMMLAQAGGAQPSAGGAPFSGLPTIPKSTMFDPNFLANLQPRATPAPEPVVMPTPEPPRMANVQVGESLGMESFDKGLRALAGKQTDVPKSNLERITDALKASYNGLSRLYDTANPARATTVQNPKDGVTVTPDGNLEQYRYNLGNIRTSNIDWQGKTTPFKGFESFETPEAGARAMFKNLASYAKATPNMTLEGAIAKWAPPSENKTKNYIEFVAKNAGIDKETLLSDILSDPATAAKMMFWMGTMEHGQNLPKVFTPEFLAKVAASANG